MPKFMPGLELSEAFYQDAIRVLMAENYPNLAYSAARLDWGSDVLGFDTPMSMDHGWGPKMTLYLQPNDYKNLYAALDDLFAYHLPLEVRGFPTHFAEPYADGGVMARKASHPIHHMVTITTVQKFFNDYLGLAIDRPLTPTDWLTLPQQKLRTLNSGRIYHDDLGLENIRSRFTWYPHDLWLYLMAVQWRRIDQDAPFLGRTGIVKDELGSRLVASRLVREIMRLGFLLSKIYAPYAKWFGAAFNDLYFSIPLSPILEDVLNSRSWRERQGSLSDAYQLLMEYHANLQIPKKSFSDVPYFHNRPFLVPDGNRFVDSLLAEIMDPEVKRLPKHLGNVDQISDNTDVSEDPKRCQAMIGAFLNKGD
jgi:hypothetical protein